VALSVTIGSDRQGKLKHIELDPQSGEIVRSRDLLALRSTLGARACCEVTPTDDGIAVALGGAVLSITADGDVRWLRMQTVTSPEDDPRWVLQTFQQPLVHDKRLYVAQPGVRSVDCLDPSTGRKQWSAEFSDLVGLVGLSGDLLVVRTGGAIRALDAADGTQRWEFAISDAFPFQLVDDQYVLIANREPVPDKAGRWQVRLTWLDATSGKPLGTTSLITLADPDPRLAPLLPAGDRLILLFGRGQNDLVRELVEATRRAE